MKLSASIPVLKRKARLVAREAGIPLHAALDRVAAAEGHVRWSQLAARAAETTPARTLYDRLKPGDMVLVAARPGQGKTLMGLKLAVEAMKAGNGSVFFTLEYTEKDLADRCRAIGVDMAAYAGRFAFDGSDAISADHIAARLAAAPRGTLAVVDYLQILDQRRDKPELAVQLRVLKSLAEERGLILVFISQVDRSYDPSAKPFPDLADVRLPNPIDLSLFDRTCFLNNGAARFGPAG